MPLHLHWFLPCHGDGREIGKPACGASATARGVRREPDIGYLAQVAQAAEGLGFTGVLTPAGLFCEDPWLITAALSAQTQRLRFMVAFRPGLVSPTLTAQMAATCQRLSGGRLLLNVVVGGDADEQHRYGDWLDHDQRYARADEFLTIMRGLWTGRPFDFIGEHYRVAGGMVRRSADPSALFVGGASSAAQRVAARHADVYLTWGEPPGQLAEQLTRARALADAEQRHLSFGTRFQVISRDTAAQAWAEAERLLAGMSPDAVTAAQQRFRRSESEGQRRAAALHRGRMERLEIYPNLWAGYGLLRPGAAIALVGSHEQVAERIEEFHALGLDHLILSGQPHLEEAYWFGEGVIPLLRRRGLLGIPGVAGRGAAAIAQAVP